MAFSLRKEHKNPDGGYELPYIGKYGQFYSDITKNGKYYVYAHINPKTSEFFYVGSGRLNRCNQITQRSKYWKNYFCKNGMVVKFIDYNLTKEQSLYIEKEIIKNTNPVCNVVYGGQSGYDEGLKRRVHAYNKDGSFFMSFDTIADANIYFNTLSNDSRIIRCLNGERKSFKGFQWSDTKNDRLQKYVKYAPHNCRKVYRYDINGNYMESYDKISEFKDGTHSGIIHCLDNNYSYKNSFWRSFKSDKIEVLKKEAALKDKIMVIDISTNIVYESIAEACRKLGLKDKLVQAKLKGRSRNDTNLRYYKNE
jgi:hypothetical protein